MVVKSILVDNFWSDGGAGICALRVLVDEARSCTVPPPSQKYPIIKSNEGKTRSLRIYIGLVFIFLPLLIGAKTANAGFIMQRPLYIGLTNGLVGYWSFDAMNM